MDAQNLHACAALMCDALQSPRLPQPDIMMYRLTTTVRILLVCAVWDGESPAMSMVMKISGAKEEAPSQCVT